MFKKDFFIYLIDKKGILARHCELSLDGEAIFMRLLRRKKRSSQ